MKKKLITLLAFVLVIALSVAGTYAYLTDEDTATNTFTVGKVDIELEEPNWEENEFEDDGSLKVFPGDQIDKDPTIVVQEDSEDCYLVATVTISKRANLYNLFDGTEVEKDWGLSLAGTGALVEGGVASLTPTPATENGVSGTLLGDVAFVTYREDVAADTITYTYFFKEIHSAEDEEVLFTTVNVPTGIENDTFDAALDIIVQAYAMQEANFADVYEAWNNTYGQTE